MIVVDIFADADILFLSPLFSLDIIFMFAFAF